LDSRRDQGKTRGGGGEKKFSAPNRRGRQQWGGGVGRTKTKINQKAPLKHKNPPKPNRFFKRGEIRVGPKDLQKPVRGENKTLKDVPLFPAMGVWVWSEERTGCCPYQKKEPGESGIF